MSMSTTHEVSLLNNKDEMFVLKNILYKLLNAGVARESGLENQYRRQSINSFSLVIILITSPYYYFFALGQLWTPLWILVGMHCLFAMILLINYWGNYKLANYVLIFTSNTCVLIMSYYFGFDSGFHLYLYLGPLFIFWIYELNQKRDIIIAIAIDVVYYILIYTLKIYDIELYTMKGVGVFEFYSINVVLNLVIMFLLFYNYTEYYKILTDSLLEKQQNLSEEVSKRIKSEEYTQKLFQDLSESYKNLEQFSFIVSHNLRSPLSNVKGFLTLYEPQEELSENDQVVQSVKESTEHLDMILTDLNVILGPKKQALETKSQVLLSDLVEEVKISLSEEIYRNRIVIKQEFNPDIKLITIKTVLNSVLFNLFQNAIKYKSLSAPPEIKVIAFQHQDLMEIRIQDNGIGIDLERYKDRLFKLYNRFSNTQEGKGIGLYLVKSNVEMLGGRIDVESQVNAGSTFIIQFKNT